VLTYTIGILVNKCLTLVVLGAGLILTGHAILTPMLQALSMLTNDFVSMARTADNATPSPHPNAWRLRNLTLAAIPLASFKVPFLPRRGCSRRVPSWPESRPDADADFLMFVFAGQALVYVLRERGRFWSSRPSMAMMLFSLADIVVVTVIAVSGFLTPPLPISLVLGLFAATLVFALLLDQVKVAVFRHLPVD